MRRWFSIVMLWFLSVMLVGCNTPIDNLNDVIEAQEFTPVYRYYSQRHYTKGSGKVDYISKAYNVLKKAGYQIKRDKYATSDSLLQVDDQLYFSFVFDVDGNQRNKNVTYDRAILKLDLIEETVTLVKVFLKQSHLSRGVILHGLHEDRYLIYDNTDELIIEDLHDNSIIKSYKQINRMVPTQYMDDTLMVITQSSVELLDLALWAHTRFELPEGAYVYDTTKFHVHFKMESDYYMDMRQLVYVSKEVYQIEYDNAHLEPIKEILLDNKMVRIEDLEDHIQIGEKTYLDLDLLRSQPFLSQRVNTYSSGHTGFDVYISDQVDAETYLLHARYTDLGLATINVSHTMLFTLKGNGEMQYTGYVPLRNLAGKVKL